jgi:hypothetical protein
VSALSSYLGVIGIEVSASAIAQWLVLVPVLALPVRGRTAAQIVGALRAVGGWVEQGSVRQIAGLIGGRKSTVHAALNVLLAGGVIAKAGRALVLA